MERLGCRRLGDLLGYDFGLCFALGGDSGGGQIGGLLGGGMVRQAVGRLCGVAALDIRYHSVHWLGSLRNAW